MTNRLDEAMNPISAGGGSYRLEVPDHWQQGKGAFGGVAIGAMVRAAASENQLADRTVRSVTVEIAAPIMPGPATIAIEPWRIGSGVSFFRASLTQADALAARATVVLAVTRDGAPRYDGLAAPAPAPWQEVVDVHAGPPIAPVYMQHLEIRPTGPFPYGGAREARTEGWVRARHRTGAPIDAGHLAALADAYWPSMAVTWDGFRPVVTVAYSLEIVGDLKSLDPEAPLFHRATCPAAGRGSIVDARELWSAEGALLALNQQTFVLLK